MDDVVNLNRRELLKTTTGLLTGLVVAGSPLALVAPGRAWAVDLTALTSAEGTELMAVARTIVPHDKLDDAAYAMVIKAIDSDAPENGASSLCYPHGICLLWLRRRGILKRRVSPARIQRSALVAGSASRGRRADAGQLVGSGELRHESHRSS